MHEKIGVVRTNRKTYIHPIGYDLLYVLGTTPLPGMEGNLDLKLQVDYCFQHLPPLAEDLVCHQHSLLPQKHQLLFV